MESIIEVLIDFLDLHTIIAMLIGGFITVATTSLLRKRERIDNANDEFLKRRIDAYKDAEKIIAALYRVESLPLVKDGCTVYKDIVVKMAQPQIPDYSEIFSEYTKLKEFKELVYTIHQNMILFDYSTSKWIHLLLMYIDNYIVVYESLETKTSKILSIAGTFDARLIGNKIILSIQEFYSRQNKTKIKRNNRLTFLFGTWQMLRYSRKFTIRKIGREGSKAPYTIQIMNACSECNLDCIMKQVKGELNE